MHIQEGDRGRDSPGVRFLLEAILGYCLLTRYYILITLIRVQILGKISPLQNTNFF